MNLGEPAMIDKYKDLPFDGIGLMRIEFIIADVIGEHPLYLIESHEEERFIDKLASGISWVARNIYPRPVVVRFSDFKTNEYRQLKGGDKYEPQEHNPMIGWRGVSRYISPVYEPGFRLECKAIKRVRDDWGLKNVYVMLPFVRTPWEVEKCLTIMKEEGLERCRDFKVWLMAEIPSIIFMADEFSKLCDGFSVGSNDLTPYTWCGQGLSHPAGAGPAVLRRKGSCGPQGDISPDKSRPQARRHGQHMRARTKRIPRTLLVLGEAGDRQPER
ncbi:MAG: putative PEP-binding protein [Candidatus Methanomethylicaceae archaeon]